MDLKSFIGQKKVIGSLIQSMGNDRVSHAYIFSGQKGIGKRTLARIFAGILLCGQNVLNKTCGECKACNLFESGSNPDYYEIGPENGSISIEEIRALQKDVMIRPLYSKRKVYLVAEADKMTVQAQNCLLKVLEEPPSYAVMILTTSSYDAVLETIRSRSVRQAFERNTLEEVQDVLYASYGERLENAEFIAQYSGGVIGTALELAGSEEFISAREKALEIILQMTHSKLLDVFDIYKFFDNNKNDIDTILDLMMTFYRDFLIVKLDKENVLINSDKKDMIINNAGAFTAQKLMKNIQSIEKTRKCLKQNANYQLAIEIMLMNFQEE